MGRNDDFVLENVSTYIMNWNELPTVVAGAEFVCYIFHFAFGYVFVAKMMSVSLIHPNLRMLIVSEGSHSSR